MTVDRNRFPFLPERIEGLADVATNVSWSWKREARRVFQMLDDSLWHLTRHNPIAMLRRIDPGRLSECARDPRFLEAFDTMMAEYQREQEWTGTWFATEYGDLPREKPVAYFCAEFGLHNSIPIYSGGLGVLAGDHCKAASDLGVPLVGVGLFYTRGYFDQKLRLDGWQEDSDEQFDVMNAPLERVYGPSREPFLARLETNGRDVHIGAWRMLVGRVPVYLLDTNLDQNHEDDRDLTSKLYIGGPEVRLKQEWILGVGGVRVLRALGVDPAAWHANEGHAAFMMVERVRELTARGVTFDEATRQVRSRSVFTTHTPVPAGHDTFTFDDLARCSGDVWSELGVSRDTFFEIGTHPTEDHRLVGVEAGGRLVEAQQLGAGGQRSGDGDELALALGQLARRGVGETAEVEHIERLVDRIGVGDRPGEHLLDRRPRRRVDGRHGEVLAHGEVVEQLDRLPRACHPPTGAGVGTQAGDVDGVDGDGAEVWHEPGDGVDERRLAGAVRADQPDEFAGSDLEVDVDDGVHTTE